MIATVRAGGERLGYSDRRNTTVSAAAFTCLLLLLTTVPPAHAEEVAPSTTQPTADESTTTTQPANQDSPTTTQPPVDQSPTTIQPATEESPTTTQPTTEESPTTTQPAKTSTKPKPPETDDLTKSESGGTDGPGGSAEPDDDTETDDDVTTSAFSLYQSKAIAEAIEQRIVRFFPVAGFNAYSDSWGAPRSGGRTHKGADIFAPKMTPVVAVNSGMVTTAAVGHSTAGTYVKIQHDNGAVTAYMHLNNDTPGTDDGNGVGIAFGVEEGVFVVAGQIIGYVGDSGNAESTNPHLHFEYRANGSDAVDPYQILLSVSAPLQASANSFARVTTARVAAHTATAQSDILPFTGPDTTRMAAFAYLLLAFGLVFVLGSLQFPVEDGVAIGEQRDGSPSPDVGNV